MEGGWYPYKLKKYRRIAGYSQKKVTPVIGLAVTSVISRWKRGTVLPALHHIFKLSKLYEILPHELFDLLWNQTVVDGLSITNF